MKIWLIDFYSLHFIMFEKRTVNVSKYSHLKEAKSPWAEFIIPLPLLQRQILDELIYEQLV